jgi:hypothetical protein
LQANQYALVDVFMLAKMIELNMLEEKAMMVGFNTWMIQLSQPQTQQQCGQLNKVVPQKFKRSLRGNQAPMAIFLGE